MNWYLKIAGVGSQLETLSRKITSNLLNYYKNNVKESDFFVKIEDHTLFIYYHLRLEKDELSEVSIDVSGNHTSLENGYSVMNIFIDQYVDRKDINLQMLYFEILEVVRHELEHLNQLFKNDNRLNIEPVPEREKGYSEILEFYHYIMNPIEIEAWSASIYLKAKKTNRDFKDLLKETINVYFSNFGERDRKIVLEKYRYSIENIERGIIEAIYNYAKKRYNLRREKEIITASIKDDLSKLFTVLAISGSLVLMFNSLSTEKQQVIKEKSKQLIDKPKEQAKQELQQEIKSQYQEELKTEDNSILEKGSSVSDEQLFNFIAPHEVIKRPPARVYKDSRGYLTIGWGTCIDPRVRSDLKGILEPLNVNYKALLHGKVSLNEEQMKYLFKHDLQTAKTAAISLMPNFSDQPEQVQAILVDMAYNLGSHGLSKFKETLKLIEIGNYKEAANHLKKTPWFNQVGKNRSSDIINILNNS